MAQILVAEDDQMTQRLIEKCLASPDRDIFCVDDGAQCMESLKSWVPDLLLLDVMMPNMNGLEVLEAVRGNPQIAQMPVIMLTSRSDKAIVKKALSLSVNDFILKPVNAKNIRPRVQLQTYHPEITEVRHMLENLHMHDPALLSQLGFREIDPTKYCLYPVRNQDLPICLKIPFGVLPANLANKDDATILSNVAIYGRGLQWRHLWPNQADIREAKPKATDLSEDDVNWIIEEYS